MAITLAVCALLAPRSAASAAIQESELRIVVLEGEDSVSIIESGATVPTRVEVRDGQDRPVSGASVELQLGEDSSARLNGGVQQVVRTTNEQGQVTVTVTPIEAGTVQLSVTVTLQGQTATEVIVQTNFATAAEAEAAGVEAPAEVEPDAGGETSPPTTADTEGVGAEAGVGVDPGTGGDSGGVAVVAAPDGGLGTGALVGIIGGVGGAVGVGVAVAGGGSSPSSRPTPPTTVPSASVPSRPSPPTVTPGDGQLVVSWGAPASNGAAITSYHVRDRASGGAWGTRRGPFLDRRATLRGLRNGTAYEVGVRAVNSVGEGPWSASASGTPMAGDEITLTNVRFVRVQEDTPFSAYWVSVTARNTGPRALERAVLFPKFYDRNGNAIGGTSQGLSFGRVPRGEERTHTGFQWIRNDRRSRVAYYRFKVDPDTIRCIGCDREYSDVPGAANVASLAGLSVADAAAGENVDDTINFAVMLDRAAGGTVSVDYATSDGSAVAGADYAAQSGTLIFSPGERSKTIQVVILDDSHDEGRETFTLALSNAFGAVIVDGQASGRIENHDPLPRALMARFGRTAAVHVVEQVEERLQAPREPGFEGLSGGQELRGSMERDMALSGLSRSAVPVAALEVGAPASPIRLGIGQLAFGDPGNRVIGGGTLLDVGGGVLTGSTFALNRETGRGGMFSFWSRGAQSSFVGREGALAFGGDVRTTMFGADYAKGPVVVGLSLSNSRGLGEYTGADGGRMASSVTGLYPWLGYKATDRVTVWGVAGYGVGEVMLAPGGEPGLESGLSMAMAAGGTRGELIGGGTGGFGLALKADALWVGTIVEGVEGSAGRLAASEAAVTRFRTGLEGSHDFLVAGRISLTPSAEVGLRHDGGDAERGAGMDVGGGVVVSDSSTGLTVNVRMRMLVVHEAEGFREQGVSVSLSYDPTPLTPLGFMARVAPSWGGQATSGAEAVWGRQAMAGPADGGFASGNRLDTEVGYGLPLGSRFVGTPRVGFAASEYGRDHRIGYGVTMLEREALSLEFGVDARRRESLMKGGADNGFRVGASLRW